MATDTSDGIFQRNETPDHLKNGLVRQYRHDSRSEDRMTFPGHARSRRLYSNLEVQQPRAKTASPQSTANCNGQTDLRLQQGQSNYFSSRSSTPQQTVDSSRKEWPRGMPPKGPKSLYLNVLPPQRLRQSADGAEDTVSTTSDLTSSSGLATSGKTSSTSSTSSKCYNCKKIIEPLAKSVKCSTCRRNCHIRCLPQSKLDQNSTDKLNAWRCRRCLKKQKAPEKPIIQIETHKASSAGSESSYSPPGAATPVEFGFVSPVSLESTEYQLKASLLNSGGYEKCGVTVAKQNHSANSPPDLPQRDLSRIQTRIPTRKATISTRDQDSRHSNELQKIKSKHEAPTEKSFVRRSLSSSKLKQTNTKVSNEADANTYNQDNWQDQEPGERLAENTSNTEALMPMASDNQLGYLAGWDAKAHNDQKQIHGVSKVSHRRENEDAQKGLNIVSSQLRNGHGIRQALVQTVGITTSSRSTSVAPSTASNVTGDLQRKEQTGVGSGSATTPEDEAGVTLPAPKTHGRNVKRFTDTVSIGSPKYSQGRLSHTEDESPNRMPSNVNRVGVNQKRDSARSPLPHDTPQYSKGHRDFSGRRPSSPSAFRDVATGYPSCLNCGKKLLASTSNIQNPLCTHCKAVKQPKISGQSPIVPGSPQISNEDGDLLVEPTDALFSVDLSASKLVAPPAAPNKRQIPAPSYGNLFHKNKKPRISNKPVPVNYAPIRKSQAVDGSSGLGLLRLSAPLRNLSDSPSCGSPAVVEQSQQEGKDLELESAVHETRKQTEALREELRKNKADSSATQKSDRQNFDLELRKQREQHENDIELANKLNEEQRAQNEQRLKSEQDARREAEVRASIFEKEMFSLKEQLVKSKVKSPSPHDIDDKRPFLEDQIERWKAEGIKFEEDSGSDSEPGRAQNPHPTKRGIGPTFCRQKSCLGFTEIFPGYFSIHLNREAKMAEIAARPRRKKTFKRVLPLWHSGREKAPPQQIFEVPDERTLSFTTLRRKANRGGSGTDDAEEEVVAGFGTWSEFIGVPKTFVPTLTKEKELAFRDGTRDGHGRLPRAREIFKVHDKNAARLI